MKLTTSKGNEYSVDFIEGPTITDGLVVLQMHDDRRLPEIAAEFDGLKWLKRESEEQGDKEFTGYTTLQRIARLSGGEVVISLGRSASK